MNQEIYVYNTLTRKKEKFEPANAPHVGMYVCGPTVYGEPHLGHVRMGLTFDVLFRYLSHVGYKVRFVRNITDVGHLEDEVAGTGEDKVSKRAKLEQLEPMEIVQKYKNIFNDFFQKMNILPPSIEPLASGHIIEQQLMIDQILANGYAYESGGSVYFDIEAYNKKHHYGKLSGRKVEDMLENTRSLEGQQEKRSPLDFALWKKAAPEHLMRWPSKWSDGFPGWHLECSVMGTKYLGETFDIHGGGMDLTFPHHECEIAQCVATGGKEHVRYWMHNNMITIDGQKMAKSLNNFITMKQMFNGEHEKLAQGYSPMVIRFFILQAHYRSTLDFSNEALQASEKGLERLLKGIDKIAVLPESKATSIDVQKIIQSCYDALNDDLNTPIAISYLFDGIRFINSVHDGKETITAEDKGKLQKFYNDAVGNVLGIQQEASDGAHQEIAGKLIDMLLQTRMDAKANKDFALADKIRNELTEMGVVVRDKKDGFEWELV